MALARGACLYKEHSPTGVESRKKWKNQIMKRNIITIAILTAGCALAAEPSSPWHVSTHSNPVTDELTTVAVTGERGKYLFLRLTGKTLECYLETGEFLETVENMESTTDTVEYRFDHDLPERHVWLMGANNESLFCPNPTSFIASMRKAQSLSIQYKPADKIPQAVTFDVSQLPAAFSNLAAAADKADAVLHVHPCKSSEGDWCWSYEGKESVWSSIDEAVQSYIRAHGGSN